VPSRYIFFAGFGLVAGLAALAWWKKDAIKAAAAAAGDAVNVTSDKNLAYRAANALTEAVTGDANTSFGSKLYDWLNPGTDINAPVTQADIDKLRAGRAQAEVNAADTALVTDYYTANPWAIAN
jgi:hypothetical protein